MTGAGGRGPGRSEALVLMRTRLPGGMILALLAALYPALLPSATTPREVGLVAAGGVLSLALVRGLVAAELHAGTHLLWIQKGGRLEHRYLARLVWVVLLAMGAHAILLGGSALLDPGAPPLSSGAVATYLLVDLSVVAVGFAVTCAGVPLELVAVILLVLGPGMLGSDAQVAPERWGRWAPWLAAQRFPTLEIHALAKVLDGGPPPSWAVARVLAYPAAWIGIGWVALRLRLRRW